MGHEDFMRKAISLAVENIKNVETALAFIEELLRHILC